MKHLSGHVRGLWLVVALVITLLIALALPRAAAAKPFTLKPEGQFPHIAVDDAGTGHIVWNERVIGGDDVLHYCRLPRGAKACAPERVFNLPGGDSNGPRALFASGQLTLLSSRCCFPEEDVLIMQSSDGGATFGAVRSLARSPTLTLFPPMANGGGAAIGPGPFQISMASSSSFGTYFQAAPMSAGAPVDSYAQLDNDVTGPIADTTNPSVAFADPLSPVVAYEQITSGRTFIRSWGGSGDHNNVLNWTPSRLVGAGTEPRLAGGLRGLYLLYLVGKPSKTHYVARRITPAGPGSKIPVSGKGSPFDSDFTEDAGGNLHAVWVDNEDPDKLRYSRSTDGQRFSDPSRLAKGPSNLVMPKLGAADDGGGWAVWMAANEPSTIRAAPFGPVGGGGGGEQPCVPKVSYGKSVILAREGCLQKKGDSYSTTGGVRLNGLDLEPLAAGGAQAAAATKIVLDTGSGAMTSSGKVRTKAGNVQLDEAKLAWKLPKNGGEIRDLAGNPALFDTGKLKVEFLGLPVLGKTTPKIGGAEGMTVPVNLKLPQPFDSLLGGGVTGSSTLRLDNATPGGLRLDSVSVRAGSIFLGIAEVRNLALDFVGGSGPFVLDGSAEILLPVIKSSLDTNVGLRAGAFDHAQATLNFDAPGRPVSQFTFLRSIGFQVLTDPLKLAGSASVTAGPTIPVLNVAAARVDGTVSYTFPKAPAPGVFRADGKGFIANIPTADVVAQYETSGKLTLDGSFNLGIKSGPQLSGSVNGAVDFVSGGFDLSGSGSGCGIPAVPATCIGVGVLLSKKAAAGCGEYTIGDFGAEVTLSAGLARYWSGGGFEFFAGCNLKPFKSVSKARISATSANFRIAKGLPQANIKIDGLGAAPRVRLTGPGGQTLTSPTAPARTAESAVGSIGPSAPDKATFAALAKPQPGTWTVDVLAGSAEIGQVDVAEGLAEPNVSAKVRKRKGRKRALVYNARRIDGQRIRFYELGKGVSKRIGVVKGGGKGALNFSAADGPNRSRRIVASIDSFGLPRERLFVGSYKAPGPIKPARPKRLRLRRKGGKLLISWRRAKSAERYLAQVNLKDGRRLAMTTKTTRLKIRNVDGIDSAKVKVAGLKVDNTPGTAAKAKLKAKPKKRGKRRR